MLRASAVELTFTVTDIEEALESFALGRLQELRVELESGAILLRHKVALERLPMAVPVELRFHLRAVEGTAIELGVTWTNMALVPGFVKEIALQKAFEPLPGRYAEGLYRLDLAEVLEHVPVSFRIKGVAISRSAVKVELADLIAFPIEPAGLAEVKPGALVPVPAPEEQTLPEHQSFYQKLRERVRQFAAERAPRWAQPLVPWVLAVPDFFVLIVRLARDERVPAGAKLIAGATIAYFISPVDLIPDPIPLIGEIDDLALALFAVEKIAQMVPHSVVQEAWPGEGDVLVLVREGIDLITRVLPGRMIAALQKVLKR
ncbi:MAG: YkvA family protein [Pseudomonadota bacterium]